MWSMENGKVLNQSGDRQRMVRFSTSLKWSVENGKVLNQSEVINGEW